MDGSNSRISVGAATRKRRSSILKSQRTQRTPLSELEFNVATPVDNTKSRRVSFSRRNGVAEFEITEATTAWKNVYEEHNKSLESSVNDSNLKCGKKPVMRVEHLGGRMADAQFEDAEAEVINTTSQDQLITSFNADMQECTSDEKSLLAPQRNFELSQFTDHQTNQLFDDDANPVMKEMTDQINVNFSAVAPLGDEYFEVMQEDLDQDEKRGNMSYIDVDFNATHFSLNAEESEVSDMSITATIHSPKVAASKTMSKERKPNEDNWVNDKENIVVNPYVAPLPSENFAVTTECDDVLIFDGKKCKFQSDISKKDPISNENTDLNPDSSNKRRTVGDNVDDISVTQAAEAQIILPPQDLTSESKAIIDIVYDDKSNISITQAVPSNVILSNQHEVKPDPHKTIHFDDFANITVTQALPSNIFEKTIHERRKTIVYGNDDGHISMTETVPGNILVSVVAERRKTIVYENDEGHVSMTEVVPANIVIPEVTKRRKTILNENDEGDVSMTEAVPTNLIMPEVAERRKTILYENDEGHISMTDAVPANIIIPENAECRRTTIYGNDNGHVSITEAIPAIMKPKVEKTNIPEIYGNDDGHMSMTETVPGNIMVPGVVERRKTIIYENDEGHVSMTEVVPANIVIPEGIKRRKTILYGNDEGDVSMTEAVPTNIIMPEVADRRKTIVYGNDEGHISMTDAVPASIIIPENAKCRRTSIYGNDNGHVSITEAIPANIMKPKAENSNIPEAAHRRKTILYQKENDDISISQSIPINIIQCTNHVREERKTKDDDVGDLETTQAVVNNSGKENSIFFENEISKEVHGRLKDLKENVIADDSISNSVYINQNTNETCNKRQTVVCNDDKRNVSITLPLPADTTMAAPLVFEKKNTNKYEDTVADICVAQAVTTDLIHNDTENIVSNIKAVEKVTNVTVLYDDERISQTHMGPRDIKIENMKKSISFDEGCDHADKSITSEPQLVNNASIKNITISDDNLCTFSTIKPIPAQMISIQTDLEDISKTEKPNILVGENYTQSIAEHQDFLIYEAAIKLNKTNQEISEGKPVLPKSDDVLGSVERASTSVNDKQKMESHHMEEDFSTSADSMIEIRDDSSNKNVEVQKNPASVKASILNDLLDMSNASMDDGQEDKNLMIKLISDTSSGDVAGRNDQKGSKESYLLIKDSDQEQVDEQSSMSRRETPALESQEPLAIVHQKEKRHGIVSELQQKLGELKYLISHKTSPKPKHIKVICSDRENISEQNEIGKAEPKNRSQTAKTDITANNSDDTNAILDALSSFIDSRASPKDFTCEDKNEVPAIKVKGHIAIEHKTEANDTRRSLIPDRKSMVRSREDLLKDISMAQAMIKYADDDMDESGEATPTLQEDRSPCGPAARMSNEVVKTLKFDEDDSIRELSSRHEPGITPLKKTAFGETTYMQDHVRDSKTKVIPGFLEEYSNNIKDLMKDLVKPMADMAPYDFYIGKSPQKTPSTCSTQIQANLLTSSQIDLEPDLESEVQSGCSTEYLPSLVSRLGNKSIARAQQDKSPVSGRHLDLTESETGKPAHISFNLDPTRKPQPVPSRVLIFDHHNPLNNVLIPVIDDSEVHKYNPRVSKESLSVSERSNATQVSDKDIQHNVESRVVLHNLVLPSGDASPAHMANASSFTSDVSKPTSNDQAVNAQYMEVKDTEVNTVIIMKRNKELLDASSSLTLVDDTLAQKTFEVDMDSSVNSQKKVPSAVRVIFKIKEQDSSIKLDSDLTSNDDDLSEAPGKCKKRMLSPSKHNKKHCTFATEEVTPKPASKIQKVSNTPKVQKRILSKSPSKTNKTFNENERSRAQQCAVTVTAEGTNLDETSSQDSAILSPDDEKKHRRKSKDSSRHKRPGTAVTIQHLITEYSLDPNIDRTMLSKQILGVLCEKGARSENSIASIESATKTNTEDGCKSVDVVSSCVSSKRNSNSDSEGVASVRSECQSRTDWRPELLNEMSSKNLIAECDSSVNVVAKIDVLPFMGTSDCEWESRGADAWSFRLLRARLRLAARLEHRHDNASRTRVRADTPLHQLRVELAAPTHKKEDPIATLCVRFAAEAMRHFVELGGARAGDVPALLRRCAGVARVAMRWGRAMHAARAHLAFTLTDDGELSLKVANIPLRSVWEVTMRVELVAEDAREVPWPRAGRVRVARVVSACPVRADALARLLAPTPRDWGHAPRAIWKIFKYLKHKTRDDDDLLAI